MLQSPNGINWGFREKFGKGTSVECPIDMRNDVGRSNSLVEIASDQWGSMRKNDLGVAREKGRWEYI
jgi:hypothetical protein